MPWEATSDTQQLRPRRDGRQQRALQFLAAATITVFAGLAFPPLGVGNGLSEPWTEDADLQVERRSVSDEDNGFPLFDLEPGSVYRPGSHEAALEAERLAAGEGSNWELAEEILERNADVLHRLEESSKRPDFQLPHSEDPLGFSDVTAEWSRVAQLLTLRAFLRTEKEGVHAGLQEAMTLMRFGQRVERAQGSLVTWMAGSAFKLKALDCIHILLDKDRLRSEQLVALGRQLDRYRADREGFVFAARLEYRFLIGEIENELQPADIDTAKRRLAHMMHRLIPLATDRLGAWGLELPVEVRSGDPELAAAYADRAARSWHHGLHLGGMEDAVLLATRALLALRAHKLDHGRLARNLSELVPEYLDEVPVDPFDGRPLRYVPSRRLLYSVGADLRDRGGSHDSDPVIARRDRDEPTFRISF